MAHIIFAVAVLLMPHTVQSFDTGGAVVKCVAVYNTRAFLCADKRLLEASWPDTPSSAPARPFAPAAGGQGDPCAAPVAPLAADVETSRARLWVLDGGDEQCPPQVFVYDIRGNKEIWRCPMDSVPVGAAKMLAVDSEAGTLGTLSGGGGVRAYVGDSGRGGLVVLALNERRYWFLDVDARECGITGVRANAVAIARRPAAAGFLIGAPKPALYLLDPSDDQLLSVDLVTERARPAPPVYDRRPEVVSVRATCVGRLLGASSGLAFDFRLGLHYFLRRDAAAVCWDTRRPLNAEAHKVLLQEAIEKSNEIRSCSSPNDIASLHPDSQNPASAHPPDKEAMGQDQVSSQTPSEFDSSVPPGIIGTDEIQLLEEPHKVKPQEYRWNPQDQSKMSPQQLTLSLNEQEISISELLPQPESDTASSENPSIARTARDLSIEIFTESVSIDESIYTEGKISGELTRIDPKIEEVCHLQDSPKSRENLPYPVYEEGCFKDQGRLEYVAESSKEEMNNDKVSRSINIIEINDMKNKYLNEFVASLLSAGNEYEEIHHDSACSEKDNNAWDKEWKTDESEEYAAEDILLMAKDQSQIVEPTYLKQHSNEYINSNLYETNEDVYEENKRQPKREISSVEEDTERNPEGNIQSHRTEKLKENSRDVSQSSKIISSEVEDENTAYAPSTLFTTEYEGNVENDSMESLPERKFPEGSTDFAAEEIEVHCNEEKANSHYSEDHSSATGKYSKYPDKGLHPAKSIQYVNELKENSYDTLNKNKQEGNTSEIESERKLADMPPGSIDVARHEQSIDTTNEDKHISAVSAYNNKHIVLKSPEHVQGSNVFSEEMSGLKKRLSDNQEDYVESTIGLETTADRSFLHTDLQMREKDNFNLHSLPTHSENGEGKPVSNEKEYRKWSYFSDQTQSENYHPQAIETMHSLKMGDENNIAKEKNIQTSQILESEFVQKDVQLNSESQTAEYNSPRVYRHLHDGSDDLRNTDHEKVEERRQIEQIGSTSHEWKQIHTLPDNKLSELVAPDDKGVPSDMTLHVNNNVGKDISFNSTEKKPDNLKANEGKFKHDVSITDKNNEPKMSASEYSAIDDTTNLNNNYETPSSIGIAGKETKGNMNNKHGMNIEMKRFSYISNSPNLLLKNSDNPIESDIVLSSKKTPNVISLENVPANECQIFGPLLTTTEDVEIFQEDQKYKRSENSKETTTKTKEFEVEPSHKEYQAFPVCGTPELENNVELKEEKIILSSELEWAVTGTIRPDRAVCGSFPQSPAMSHSHENIQTSQVRPSSLSNVHYELKEDITNHFAHEMNPFLTTVGEVSHDEANMKTSHLYEKDMHKIYEENENIFKAPHSDSVDQNYESLSKVNGVMENLENCPDSSVRKNHLQNPLSNSNSKLSSNEQMFQEDTNLLLTPFVLDEVTARIKEKNNGQVEKNSFKINENSSKSHKNSLSHNSYTPGKDFAIEQKHYDHHEIEKDTVQEISSLPEGARDTNITDNNSSVIKRAGIISSANDPYLKETQGVSVDNLSGTRSLSQNLEDSEKVIQVNNLQNENGGLEDSVYQSSLRFKRKDYDDYDPSSPDVIKKEGESKEVHEGENLYREHTQQEETIEKTNKPLEKEIVLRTNSNYNAANKDKMKRKLPPLPGLPYPPDEHEMEEELEVEFGEFQQEPVHINVYINILAPINIVRFPSHPDTIEHTEGSQNKIIDPPLLKAQTLHEPDFIGLTTSELPVEKPPVPEKNDEIIPDVGKSTPMILYVPPESTRELIRTRRGLGDSPLNWKFELPQPQKFQLQIPTTLAMPPLLGFPSRAGTQNDQRSNPNSSWQRHCVLVQKFSYF